MRYVFQAEGLTECVASAVFRFNGSVGNEVLTTASEVVSDDSSREDSENLACFLAIFFLGIVKCDKTFLLNGAEDLENNLIIDYSCEVKVFELIHRGIYRSGRIHAAQGGFQIVAGYTEQSVVFVECYGGKQLLLLRCGKPCEGIGG